MTRGGTGYHLQRLTKDRGFIEILLRGDVYELKMQEGHIQFENVNKIRYCLWQ